MRSTPTLFFFAIALTGCGVGDLGGSQYGLLRTQAPSGEVFYFRREARGLNHDTLSLSKNSDFCAEPDPNNSLIFTGLGPVTVFYKFAGDELHLYLTSKVDVPAHFSNSTKPVFHKINNLKFIELRESYAEKGLRITEVPLDPKLSCPN
ncbi:MAG: hypothetical protein QUS14_02715 [Pyrinomonadaceae bacterium]|nr:hypothetical protein [Pyrinomonadaceae bacterium]